MGKRKGKPSARNNRIRQDWPALVLLCIASALILANLGNQYLWQDEAQTALVSKTVLTHGIPLGYDGKNYFSQEFGLEYGKNYIWKWHTWLQFYVLAAFFAVFGVSTFVARLPFALFGIATILLTYTVAKSLWKSRRVGVTAAVLLLTSVPFLILVRQCRYYSPSAFFSLLALYCYVKILERKRYAPAAFIISATLLFHTHHIYGATLLATALVHSMLFRRDRFRSVLYLSVITAVINLPWILWLSHVSYGSIYGDLLHGHQAFSFAAHYLAQLAKYVFPPAILLLPVVIWIINRARHAQSQPLDADMRQKLALLLLFIPINIVALLFSPLPFFRYLTPLIPVCCMIMALILESGMRVHVGIGIAIIAVLVSTGHMKDYLYEVTHDYDGPIEGIVKYLNSHGRPNDIVAITYGDLPLKFYTKMRVVGGLTGEDLSPAKKADWVIVRKYIVTYRLAGVVQYLENNVPRYKYEEIVIDYPDTAFENRESPEEHRFRTDSLENRVVIFRRIEN